jgi:hypothetical protein
MADSDARVRSPGSALFRFFGREKDDEKNRNVKEGSHDHVYPIHKMGANEEIHGSGSSDNG